MTAEGQEAGATENLQMVIERLTRKFIADAPGLARQLRDALARSAAEPAQWVEIQGLAHRLAGMAAYFGFDAIGEQAGMVEHLLRKEDDASLPARIAEIEMLAAMLAAVDT